MADCLGNNLPTESGHFHGHLLVTDPELLLLLRLESMAAAKTVLRAALKHVPQTALLSCAQLTGAVWLPQAACFCVVDAGLEVLVMLRRTAAAAHCWRACQDLMIAAMGLGKHQAEQGFLPPLGCMLQHRMEQLLASVAPWQQHCRLQLWLLLQDLKMPKAENANAAVASRRD